MFGFGGGVTFDPAKDIPDLSGKVILVTGGNSGLGAETIKNLARHNPSEIWLAARTRSTAESTINEVKSSVPDANIILLELQLGDFSSIASAVETFTKQSKRLDYLFLNAGIAFSKPGLTQSGYEVQFGTNHVGHALLTKLLLPTLLRTAKETPNSDVRIVVVSSAGHKFARSGIDFAVLKTDAAATSSFTRYAISKLANILFTNEIAKRYPTIKTASIHPGTVGTPIFRLPTDGTSSWGSTAISYLVPLVAVKVEVGVLNQLWAAFGKSESVISGRYYEPVGKKGALSSFAKDEKLEAKLWDWTEGELAEKGWSGWP